MNVTVQMVRRCYLCQRDDTAREYHQIYSSPGVYRVERCADVDECRKYQGRRMVERAFR